MRQKKLPLAQLATSKPARIRGWHNMFRRIVAVVSSSVNEATKTNLKLHKAKLVATLYSGTSSLPKSYLGKDTVT